MSETSGEKSEQPTPKRLRDVRKKGQVAKSKEIVSAAVISSALITIWIFWPFFLNSIKELIILPSLHFDKPFREAFSYVLQGVINKILIISAPLVCSAIIVSILAYILQFGVLFSLDPVIPKFSHIHPVEGFKRIFSLHNLVELLKSIVKIIFLTVLIYMVIRDAIPTLIKIPNAGLPGVLKMLGAILGQTVIYTLLAFLIIAILDHFFQQHLFIRQNKMSKDEVKKEYKEMEGDPFIKGKRKHIHQEYAMSAMIENVKKASVVITNPTHIAVALLYEKGETPLPMIVAKGENLMAKRIIDVARDAGVPIMQNIPLAHNLYDQGKIDNYIPTDLLKPVAEVLRWVIKLNAEKNI